MLGAHHVQPFPIRMRVSVGGRERLPRDPSALGPSLFEMLEDACEKGRPPPVLVALQSEQATWYDLVPLLRAGGDLHRFAAAASASEGVEALALLGVLGVRLGGGRRFPGAIAFVEWPDGSWWSAMRPVGSRGPRDDWPALTRSAQEGYPRPGGLGGWWARGRLEGVRLEMKRGPGVSPTVH